MDTSYEEEYVENSRGVKLCTCRWLPPSPKALVFICHGYGMECSGFMREVGTRLAMAGYAVFGIDYEGHGRSMGARCYIKKFEYVVNDCDHFFKSICAQGEYSGKSRFLYGESMGGAVTLLLHKKDPAFWTGAVLVAPMYIREGEATPCGSELVDKVEEIIPKWKIVPTKDVIDSAFKDPIKREQVRGNKLIYQDKPRLKTALEMLRVSMKLEGTLHEVTLPFFVLHGEADVVTDPEVSKALYEQASSQDKTIQLYPGMWHGLTSGEPDDNVEIVFANIIAWLEGRSIRKTRDHRHDRVTAATSTQYTPQSPTSYPGNGIERLSASAIIPPQRTPARRKTGGGGSYLCGLKGRRLFQHSAM